MNKLYVHFSDGSDIGFCLYLSENIYPDVTIHYVKYYDEGKQNLDEYPTNIF